MKVIIRFLSIFFSNCYESGVDEKMQLAKAFSYDEEATISGPQNPCSAPSTQDPCTYSSFSSELASDSKLYGWIAAILLAIFVIRRMLGWGCEGI